MNSSDALRARRDAERAERRRDERLQQRADEQAEREREEARAEERRQEAAREEAALRTAEESARQRRQDRLVQLRKTRLATARERRARDERRLLASREVDERRRADATREQAARERKAEAADREAAARRADEQESIARAERLEQQRAESQRSEREGERQATARRADTERRAGDRQAAQTEADRREQRLEEQRRQLAEQRRAADQRAGQAERIRAEAAARVQEVRRRELLVAERQTELQTAAREARLREQAEQRAAAQRATARAAELRAREAGRRERERRELAAREQQDRARRAAAGSDRRAELEDTELAWLRTEGREIVAWGGEPLLLRGVAVRGLDDALAGATPLAEALSLDDDKLELLTDSWGVNLVRLPFRAQTIPAANLIQLDDLVGALSAAGVYTLLALEPGEAGGETPLPDENTRLAWRILADRYQAEPGALFEPYAAAAPLAEGWPAAALELIHEIRSRHQSSLLLLPEHGGELGPVHNLVYAARLAPGSRVRLDERFAAFAARRPVLVSDWREDGVDPAGPATVTAGLLERHGLGWCAGNWNAHPRLVADAAVGRLTETRFGLVVRRALAAPVPPALTPF